MVNYSLELILAVLFRTLMLLFLFLQDFYQSFIEILIALEKGFDFLDFFFGQWFLFNQAPNNLAIRENEHHDF